MLCIAFTVNDVLFNENSYSTSTHMLTLQHGIFYAYVNFCQHLCWKS